MYSTKKLKELRLEKKYSVKYMADVLNICPAYYCLIENKKRKLYYEMAIKIANIFDVKPDDLFYSEDV